MCGHTVDSIPDGEDQGKKSVIHTGFSSHSCVRIEAESPCLSAAGSKDRP